jgi:hypothetical protein
MLLGDILTYLPILIEHCVHQSAFDPFSRIVRHVIHHPRGVAGFVIIGVNTHFEAWRRRRGEERSENKRLRADPKEN